jgi:Zn-dependent alcohol dehydrogenase
MCRDFPRILALYQTGKLKPDELISQHYRLDQISDAHRGVIVFDGA